VHYEGKPALRLLERSFKGYLDIMRRDRGRKSDAKLERLDRKAQDFVLHNILPRIDQHVKADEKKRAIPHTAPVATNSYRYQYRHESLFEAHAGIGPFRRYIRIDEKPYSSLIEHPQPAARPARILLASAGFVAFLSTRVFETFNLRTDALVASALALENILPPDPEAESEEVLNVIHGDDELEPVHPDQLSLLWTLRNRASMLADVATARSARRKAAANHHRARYRGQKRR
jgi:hypothetical protein